MGERSTHIKALLLIFLGEEDDEMADLSSSSPMERSSSSHQEACAAVSCGEFVFEAC